MNIMWNAESMNQLAAKVEAGASARIARSAEKIAAGRFGIRYGKTPRGFEVWSPDAAARTAEYGDGVNRPTPWANQAITGAGYASHE